MAGCIEQSSKCAGPVEPRWPGYGERNFMRCEFHGERRVEREREAIERYGNPDSPCPPAGFDPTYAGERWDDE